METAMSSWSDSSNNEIIRPKTEEPMEIDKDEEVMIIEDSEDMKLVYEDTQMGKKSPEIEQKKISPKCDTPTSNKISESNFLKQAKVTFLFLYFLIKKNYNRKKIFFL